jgi:uncharacterized membrane protein
MRQLLALIGLVLLIVSFFAISKGDALVALLCFAGGVACFIPIGRRMREIDNDRRLTEESARQNSYNAAQKEAAHFENLSTTKVLPSLNHQVGTVILEPGETCVLISQNAQHIVIREKTQYVGGTAGVSFKVSKRIRVRAGGFKGEPVKTSHSEVGDTGTLYLTDHRFIFAGSNEVVTVPLSKIASVRDDSGTVEVIQENRAKPLLIRIAEEFRASAIVAATLAMTQRAVSHSNRKKPSK